MRLNDVVKNIYIPQDGAQWNKNPNSWPKSKVTTRGKLSRNLVQMGLVRQSPKEQLRCLHLFCV